MHKVECHRCNCEIEVVYPNSGLHYCEICQSYMAQRDRLFDRWCAATDDEERDRILREQEWLDEKYRV